MNSIIVHTRETAGEVMDVVRKDDSIWLNFPVGPEAEVTVFLPSPAAALRLAEGITAAAHRAEAVAKAMAEAGR